MRLPKHLSGGVVLRTIKRRLSSLILSLSASPLLQKQLYNFGVSLRRCRMESRARLLLPNKTIPQKRRAAGQLRQPNTCTGTHVIPSLDVCSLLEQQPHHIGVSLMRCRLKSCDPILLPDKTIPQRKKSSRSVTTTAAHMHSTDSTHLCVSIDVSPLLYEQPHHIHVSLLTCYLQNRGMILLPDATVPP